MQKISRCIGALAGTVEETNNGYIITTPDGEILEIPAGIFEKYFLAVPSLHIDLETLVDSVDSTQVDPLTLLAHFHLFNGYEMRIQAQCREADKYSDQLGILSAKKKAQYILFHAWNFLKYWAEHGVGEDK